MNKKARKLKSKIEAMHPDIFILEKQKYFDNDKSKIKYICSLHGKIKA